MPWAGVLSGAGLFPHGSHNRTSLGREHDSQRRLVSSVTSRRGRVYYIACRSSQHADADRLIRQERRVWAGGISGGARFGVNVRMKILVGLGYLSGRYDWGAGHTCDIEPRNLPYNYLRDYDAKA